MHKYSLVMASQTVTGDGVQKMMTCGRGKTYTTSYFKGFSYFLFNKSIIGELQIVTVAQFTLKPVAHVKCKPVLTWKSSRNSFLFM